MLPPKPKEKAIPGRTGTHTATVSKFKVYSENSKLNGRAPHNLDTITTTTSRTSSLLKKGGLLSDNTTLKKDLASAAEKTRVNQDPFGRTKIGRKALADVSNIRQNSSRLQKPACSRNSVGFTIRTSVPSSSRPPIAKVNALATDASFSHNNVKASTKTSRKSFNFGRVGANETPNRTRKSFPVVKKPRQLGSNDLKSEGDIRSAQKSARKSGFSVKTRVGGVSRLNTKVTKDKASDGYTWITQKNQTGTDALQGFRKSVQPNRRTTLQISNAQRNIKGKSICSVGKSLAVTSGVRVKAATPFLPETVVQGTNSGKDNDDLKPQMLDSTSSKKSTRRKSYSSELISRSKYIEAVKEEKLPSIDDERNPLEVAEYVDEIYQYYWVVEEPHGNVANVMMPNALNHLDYVLNILYDIKAQNKSLENYMIQKDVTPQMRSILINWLVEVHLKFDLMAETLYLAVALLDRYLSLVSISKRELQLVGLTSLLLASKYEDFWHPRVKDLISISAESYTRKQFLEMEKDILKKLKFRMNLPTPYVFMLRFLKASQSEKKLEHLAFYLIELCLSDYEVLKFRPSLLCASAVYVARCTLNKSPSWTPLLEKHAHYSEIQIRECAQKIMSIHRAASSNLLKVTYDKYNRPEFDRVTSIKPLVRLDSSCSF